MKLVTGTVVNGKVVVDGDPLVEGARVTILAPDAEGTFRLDSEAEAELLRAVEEADRGEVVRGDDVLRQLRTR